MNGMSQTTIPMDIIHRYHDWASACRWPICWRASYALAGLWVNGNPDALYFSQLAAWLFNTVA